MTQMVKIEYISSFESETNNIIDVKVLEATDLMIEFKIEY